MRSVFGRIAVAAVLGGVLGTLPLFSAGAETVGAVISKAGNAYAEGMDGKRGLECGAQVREGDRIVTQAGARVALLAGDVYVQMDSATSVAIGRTPDGAPSLEVASGHVRLVDTRLAGAEPFEIRTPHSQARGLGTDTEVMVSEAKTELCEDAADLDVITRDGNASLVTRRGRCVTLRPGQPPATTPKGTAKMALAGAEGCIEVAAVDHFTPDVAAPPLTIGLAPLDPDRMILGPCDDPGSGCGGLLPPPGGDIFEQPPEPPGECRPGNPAGCVQ